MAQASGAAPSARAGWLPRQVQWPQGGTAAERAAAIGTLERLERLLLRSPALANPKGFEILPIFAGGYRPVGADGMPVPRGVIRYNVGLTMFAPTRAIAGEGSTCVSVIVNDGAPTAQHRAASGHEIYIEEERGTPIPSATQVYGGLLDVARERSGVSVLFTTGGELPWRQVTREELIDALIFEAEGKDGAKKAELQAAFARTPYQEWMDGAAERKRERERTLTEARSYQSAQEVEKLRQALEASERDVTERLRAGDGATSERFAAARSNVSRSGDDLRATLAAMSPAERALPALVDNGLTTGPLAGGYRLARDDTPTAWRVLTPRYEFWRYRASPVEVRSIRVTMRASGTCLRPQIQRALLESFRAMDWEAFRELLLRP